MGFGDVGWRSVVYSFASVPTLPFPKSQIHNGLNSNNNVAAKSKEANCCTFFRNTKAIKAPNPITVALSTGGKKPAKPRKINKAALPATNCVRVLKRLVSPNTTPKINEV